jgi:hypothetical protein
MALNFRLSAKSGPTENAAWVSEQFHRLIAGYGITCFDELIGHRFGQCSDGEVFFSSLKTERT